jgi:hypothetical protein
MATNPSLVIRKSNAVRDAYAKLPPLVKRDVDAIADTAWVHFHTHIPNARFGLPSAIELVGKVGMFLVEKDGRPSD